MSLLSSLLPAPKNIKVFEPKVEEKKHVPIKKTIPPYLHRDSYIPREPEDFGDGGAFPEIHLAQYPLGMGKKENRTENALALQLDSEGKLEYDQIIKQGQPEGKIVYSKFTDLIGYDDDDNLAKPDPEKEIEIIEKTKSALSEVIETKIQSTHKSGPKIKEESKPTYIKYTPGENQLKHHAMLGKKDRIIRLAEAPVDPLEPPRFHNKKMPAAPPSPPVPILHSPPKKPTQEEIQNWKIPPCVSNWKNPKGYTIPLETRLAADGRGLQEVQINDQFAKLAEALYIAERTAREEVEKRAQYQKMILIKQKEEREAKLRQLAQSARQARMKNLKDSDNESDSEQERERIREERKRELEYERRKQRMKKAKKYGRDEDRDVTERIALGQPPKSMSSTDQIDSRLMNYSSGMDSGFGSDDAYNLYDKPLFGGSSANQIYRPTKTTMQEYGDSFDDLTKGDRFVKESRRDGPVQFERVSEKMDEELKKVEDDPFGLNKFLTSTKNKSREAIDKIGKTGFMKASASGKHDEDALRSSKRRGRIEFEKSSDEKPSKKRK